MLAMRWGPDWRQKAGGLWLDPGAMVVVVVEEGVMVGCPGEEAKGEEEEEEEVEEVLEVV